VALAATALAVGQVGVARATNCTDRGEFGGGSPAIISGTYTINFLGSESDESGNYPVAGSGSVKVDGKGNVTGGVIRCNYDFAEYTSTIVGGCYTTDTDGTAFMAITTSDEEGASGVCNFDDGVDLQLAISYGGGQFQFSSDGSDDNTDTGYYIPFAGTANRLGPNLGWP